ncbi:T4SS effector phosphatidylinositol 3-Kinase RisK1 [Rickettsia typhi]|uniref:Uncharacterized protein n=2 Tax=Rickettsia typhi TaxID=785 RepID=Q68XM2_RICTY|nr:hypothetical protein [Rickettsia typhi]AAU03620.1 rickettsial conserved hypothetical protein [Rickettsia typhi str. Wilmington]AFE53999.1 hypothetical protein RTTH1527_00660 [Rickettsia typhi str. TH1527]AFE54838.1 hypothetical protein RTB9991CWPP_00665 [Rickettsia typhi str. B9991CWPP]
MSKAKTKQELLLQQELFNVLKTHDIEAHAKISRICERIAESVIALADQQSHTTESSYINYINQAALNTKDLAKVTTTIKNFFPGDHNKKLREIIDTPLLQNLVIAGSIERKIGLNDTLYTPDYRKLEEIIDPNDTKKVIDAMLRDKGVAQQDEFEKKGKKTTGISAGYIANDSAGNTFILKHFYKTHAACEKIQDPIEQSHAIDDRRDGVQELIGSTMYQFLLHDRAPKEGLVKADAQHPDSLYVRSKFFDNAVTLTEFCGLSGQTRVRVNDKNLKKLEGFEKAIAACHMLGDGDYHAGNLMVQNGKTITKIDHGRSFLEFHQDFGSMVQLTAEMFTHPNVCYSDAIKAGNLSFNIDKYSEALNQMISQFDVQRMEAIVDQKLDELKKAGFDPDNIPLYININNFDDLKQYYKSSIKQNFINMQEIAKGAEIVKKFSNVLPEFKNGGWLEAFANSPVKEPLLYAIKNKITIEGKDAQEWAYENNYQIKTAIGLTKEVIKERQWRKDFEGKWQEKEIEVQRDKVEVQLSDPLKSMRIQDKFTAKKFESLIINFTKHTTTKNVTDEEVEKFYDNIMQVLKKENYLNEQDIETIKQDLKYHDNIENTTHLLNAKDLKLNSKDTIYYKIGNFCEKIGLRSVANHFIKKIAPENLNKIYNTEKVIAESIKIGNILKDNKQEGLQTKRLETVKGIVVSQLQAKQGKQQQGKHY